MSTPQTSEAEEADSSRGTATRWLMTIGLMLLLYLFSIGPGVVLVEKGIMNIGTLRSIYTPVIFLGTHSRAVGDAVEWYAELWAGEKK